MQRAGHAIRRAKVMETLRGVDDADGQAQLFQAPGSAEGRARCLPRGSDSPDGSKMRQSGRV